ncbi:MFS transporter, partial [Actinomadura latina]
MAVIASVSGLNVAQPELAVAFDASQKEVLWFINIYTISLAALLLPLGALGDRWGRRPVLLAGLLVFGTASAAAGLAPSPEVMLAARLLSGAGAAMIMPVTLAVITSTFPDGERSRAIGVWTGVAGGGGILGMYLSAALVDLASWRWLFVLPVVLVAVAVAMTLRSVPNSRQAPEGGFDAVGSLLSPSTAATSRSFPACSPWASAWGWRGRWPEPPVSPSWTAGSRPCGRARRSWRSCSSTSSRVVRGTGRRALSSVDPTCRGGPPGLGGPGRTPIKREVSDFSVIARPGGGLHRIYRHPTRGRGIAMSNPIPPRSGGPGPRRRQRTVSGRAAAWTAAGAAGLLVVGGIAGTASGAFDGGSGAAPAASGS